MVHLLSLAHMSRKSSIKIATIIIVLALGAIIFRWGFRTFIYDHGTATSVSALQNVYQRAGPEIAATFTNSLIQRFPFEGKMDWRLAFIKAPQVWLSGRVDTNAFRQFVNSHPSTRFVWSGVDKNGQNWFASEDWPSAEENARIIWDRVSFKVEPDGGPWAAFIEGEVVFPSCVGTVRSWCPDWIPPEKK